MIGVFDMRLTQKLVKEYKKASKYTKGRTDALMSPNIYVHSGNESPRFFEIREYLS